LGEKKRRGGHSRRGGRGNTFNGNTHEGTVDGPSGGGEREQKPLPKARLADRTERKKTKKSEIVLEEYKVEIKRVGMDEKSEKRQTGVIWVITKKTGRVVTSREGGGKKLKGAGL